MLAIQQIRSRQRKRGINLVLAARLKEVRKRCNLTQQALADVLNVNRQTVQNWERGRARIPAEQLKKIAKELACTADELLEPPGTSLWWEVAPRVRATKN